MFSEFKAECVERGYSVDGPVGAECKPSGGMCNGKCCPSKLYWSKNHKQPGYYRLRALERTGLVDSFDKEMANG